MTIKVLQNKALIGTARAELDRRGLSTLHGDATSWLHRFSIGRRVHVGDRVKSWDILETLRFVEANLPKTAPILDIGAFASEIPVALHRLGYAQLHAIDLNPRLLQMPHADQIHYCVGNFMATPYADRSMAAITAISVIEHGFDGPKLLREVARLLQSGGYFIASFDYWPEKIDTAGVTFFDMDWLIFSREDVMAFCRSAADHGLHPVGELSFEAGERAISCGGKRYTFAWLVLQRTGAGAST
jgi:SAM-dependent methyltransferase